MTNRLPASRNLSALPILVVRGHRVMLDADLATVYGVTTRQLNQAVQRNSHRFPPDFLIRLTKREWDSLRSQSVISNGRGGRRTSPLMFTEHGAIMAAGVLNTARAVEMSVFVVRAFVRFRSLAIDHAKIAAKLKEIERRVSGHDEELKDVFAALRALVVPRTKVGRRIGFVSPA